MRLCPPDSGLWQEAMMVRLGGASVLASRCGAFAFTKILVVVGLLGVLAWWLMPRCSCGVARQSATVSDINGGIKTALTRYQTEIASYPHSLQDLVTRPSSVTNWNGPYLDEVPKDPWGHLYVYVYPGHHVPDAYDLYSIGEDGEDGTRDDIGNWTKQ